MQRELDKYLYSNTDGQPLPKPRSADLHAWFLYRGSASERVSLKEIAHHTGYNYSYVRRKYASFSKAAGNKK